VVLLASLGSAVGSENRRGEGRRSSSEHPKKVTSDSPEKKLRFQLVAAPKPFVPESQSEPCPTLPATEPPSRKNAGPGNASLNLRKFNECFYDWKSNFGRPNNLPRRGFGTECRFYSTPGGCRFGERCRNIHPAGNEIKTRNVFGRGAARNFRKQRREPQYREPRHATREFNKDYRSIPSSHSGLRAPHGKFFLSTLSALMNLTSGISTCRDPTQKAKRGRFPWKKPGTTFNAQGSPLWSHAKPCRFYMRPRGCRNGDSCPFDHSREVLRANRAPSRPNHQKRGWFLKPGQGDVGQKPKVERPEAKEVPKSGP